MQSDRNTCGQPVFFPLYEHRAIFLLLTTIGLIDLAGGHLLHLLPDEWLNAASHPFLVSSFVPAFHVQRNGRKKKGNGKWKWKRIEIDGNSHKKKRQMEIEIKIANSLTSI